MVTPSRQDDDHVPYHSPNEFTTEPVGLGYDRQGYSLPTRTLPSQPSADSSATIRHNSLPQLVTSPTLAPVSLVSRPPHPDLSRLSPTHSEFSIKPRPQTSPTSRSPTFARSQSDYSKLSSPESVASPATPAGPSPVATSLRATSNRMPSPNVARPSSAGTFSSVSTAATTGSGGRPWIPDSDASSSTSGDAPANQPEINAPGVYKIAPSQPVEFLDPRPEPSGVKLTIKQDDPDQVVIKVILPGFEVENITVALRRGHKVHIVADSYGENGGHFEKLVSLGTEVSSAQPKAEFDGSTLTVFVARRSRRHGNPVSSPDLVGSPQSSVGSPPMSADRRPSMSSLLENDQAPSSAYMAGPAQRRSHELPRPRSLTGPEGARAAAKAAREEASRRAKEQAKLLPKIGRRFHFKRDRSKEAEEAVLSSSPPSASAISPAGLSPAGFSSTSIMTTTQESMLGRNDTITARTRDLAIKQMDAGAGSSGPGSSSGSSGSRPKMRGNNLTLRPSAGASFIEAAFKTVTGSSGHHSSDETDTTPSEGSSTPRVERSGMSFTPTH